MAPTKKVFFGSLFEFSPVAIEEFRNGLRDQFEDPEKVPFISYDANTKLFCCEVELNDHDTIPTINAQIDSYVTNNGRKPNEPLESDRLKPIDGTALFDEMMDNKSREKEPNLLFETMYSSSEDDETMEDHVKVYWKPKCGDVSILSKDLAAEVTNITGCVFVPIQAEQRIRLVQGNLELALEKVRRLENVLEISATHRLAITSHAGANLLLSSQEPTSRIRFVRPVQPLWGFDRIILDQAQLPILRNVTLGEARDLVEGKGVKPINLDLENISLTPDIGLSTIFGSHTITTFGDAQHAKPRLTSGENSELHGEIQRPNSPTKFLGQKDTERVEEWRGNVDPEAAPTLPPAEPQPEVEQKPGRRRVVESDSESEGEAQRVPQSSVAASGPSQRPSVETQETTGSALGQLKSAHGPSDVDKKSEKVVRQAPNKPALKSNNMFAAIDVDDDDDDDQEESGSEEKVAARTVGGKHLNVTFEQPEEPLPTAPRADLGSSPQSKPVKPKVPAFDSSKYGLKQHMARSRQRSPTKNQLEAGPRPEKLPLEHVPARSQPLSKEASTYQPRGGRQSFFQNRPKALVDVTDDHVPHKTTMPPPGFDYRSDNPIQSAARVNPSHQQSHGDPAMRHIHSYAAASKTTHNSSGSGSSSTGPLEFTPQLTVPKRNISYLRNRTRANLEAQISASNENPDEIGKKEQGVISNRIRTDDEHSTRKYHQTMSQKMGKPAKGKSGANKQETKAEKDARIAKAKAEAYGDTNTPKAPGVKSQPKLQQLVTSDDMSAKKRQLLKTNPAMADLHKDVLAENAIQNTATKLVEELRPILQATRAYKGVVKVEVQLGQALVLKNNRLDEHRLYTLKEFVSLLNSKGETAPKVTFTNILTTNGRDIDRMMDLKDEAKTTKVWDISQPGLTSTVFEFACQDKSGSDFLFVLDEKGEHHLTNPTSTIAQVVLHAPDQIWDACAVVSGTMKLLRPAEDIVEGVEQFKESLYIPGGQQAAVFFRLPANNAFAIKAITVKRVSTHNCLLPSRENVQLRVTEVKALAHTAHATDKKLYRSYESHYDVMIREGRLHYEVAITDTSVEKVFENNPAIEIGELTPIANPNGTMFNFAQSFGLVDVTSCMLKQIDWAGSSNKGTLRCIYESVTDQRTSIVNALLPNDPRHLPIPMGTTAPPTIAPQAYQSQQHSYVAGSSSNNNNNSNNTASATLDPIVRQLQGVRAHTAAELYQDLSTGELFYYGQGGARIPVVDNDPLESPRINSHYGPILPDDSASQVGGDANNSKKMMTAVNAAAAARGKTGAVGGAGGGAVWDERPAGFW